MLEYLALALLLYIIYRFFVDGADDKDRKRWPALMFREEQYFQMAKGPGGKQWMKNEAVKMRNQRKKARKDKMLAKKLDILEEVAGNAHSSLGETAYMQQKINEMQWKINDLEWKNQHRR